MPDLRYDTAMQAARQILECLPIPDDADMRKRLPQVTCLVLGAINRFESTQSTLSPNSGRRRPRKTRQRG